LKSGGIAITAALLRHSSDEASIGQKTNAAETREGDRRIGRSDRKKVEWTIKPKDELQTEKRTEKAVMGN